MKSSKDEPIWKIWLDRFLIIDLFLVILGSIFFMVSVISSYCGNNFLVNILKEVWLPIFIPLITILITASLVTGLTSLWQSQVLGKE